MGLLSVVRSRSRSCVLVSLIALLGCGGDDATSAPSSSDSPRTPVTADDAGNRSQTGSSDGGRGRDGAVVGADASTSTLMPPAGGSSGGSGGTAPVAGAAQSAQNVTYRLIVPSSYAGAPTALLLVYSGTEGGATMTQNLISLGPTTQSSGFVRAVLDGVAYNGDGQAGAKVLDDVRAKYNIDNDRTYLLGESAGTTAALALGFHLRQSYFAAYWANDVTASDAPEKNAATLGFAPWGQAGPGGDVADATAIVNAMKASGYRVPSPAPYSGAGANQHGSPDQFIAAVSWLSSKSRQ